MDNIAVLMTCYNRKEKTLLSLKHLFAAGVPEAQLQVFLVDAASPDGTAAAVREKYPQVHVIDADSSLFWNRGMHLAWEHAAAAGAFDYYLWLNDDTMLLETALKTLLDDEKSANAAAIICGACSANAELDIVSYGGQKIKGERLFPNGSLQACDLINGNAVLVPDAIFKAIGNLDPIFPHGVGDYDYGLRAAKAGFPVYVSSGCVGICERDHDIPSYRRKSVKLRERFRVLHSPKTPSPRIFFIYLHRHCGLFVALKHVVNLYLKTLFPDYE